MKANQKYKILFPHGIMFHHFHKNKKTYQGSISANDLEKIILFIGKKNILNADEWLNEYLVKGNKLRKVCFSFDDCLISQFKIALPILKKYKITAFWYPYTSIFFGKKADLEIYRFFRLNYFDSVNNFYKFFNSYLKKNEINKVSKISDKKIMKMQKLYPFYSKQDLIFRMTRDEILGEKKYKIIMDKMLKKSKIYKKKLIDELFISKDQLKIINKEHIIGLHSHSHPTEISKMSQAKQLQEYKKNIFYLNKLININQLTMSHPCSAYNIKTLNILKKLKILIGFKANIKKDKKKYSHLEIPRIDHAILFKKILNYEKKNK